MTERNPERGAMFEFGRQLGDPSFRKLIADHGCENVQDVVVTLDETPLSEVIRRVFTRCRPPALVAVHRPTAAFGFVFLVFEPSMNGAASATQDAPTVDPNVSIGMLYDSLRARHDPMLLEIGARLVYNIEPVGELAGA